MLYRCTYTDKNKMWTIKIAFTKVLLLAGNTGSSSSSTGSSGGSTGNSGNGDIREIEIL